MAERLDLLGEIVSGLQRLAIIANASNPEATQELEDVQAAARGRKLDVVPATIRRSEDIAPAFETLKDRVQAVYVCTDSLVFINRVRINSLAQRARSGEVVTHPEQFRNVAPANAQRQATEPLAHQVSGGGVARRALAEYDQLISAEVG